MKTLAVIIAMLSVAASDPARLADELRATEVAFAKAFADRDKATFVTFIGDGAQFVQRTRILKGKDDIMSVWGELIDAPKPPFSWSPDRVIVNKSGDIGLSTGRVVDANGKHIADYASIWQRQKSGKWKIIFDGPGSRVCDETK